MFTLAPLLGPIGGGLAALAGGASPSAAAGGGGGGGGGAASSAALTTSLRAGVVVFLEGNITMLVRGVVVFEATTLAVSRNSDAADAMPQLAMVCLCVSTAPPSMAKV